jgi:5-methylcytosine-specific restriction endonuclease McrA
MNLRTRLSYYSPMNYKSLSDKQLLIQTKLAVQSERRAMTEVLHLLKEVEQRKLFCDLNYSSIMEYAMKELQYTETAALRRIRAARLLKEIPSLESKIKDGTLSLTNLDKAIGLFNREEIKNTEDKKEILKQIENQTSREAEKTLLGLLPPNPLPKEAIKPITPEFSQLKINVAETTLQKLHEARSLMGKFHINDECLRKLAEHANANIKFKKFKVRETKQDPDSRHITNQTKRETYEKSNGKCENCGSIFMLNNDHIEAFSRGGKTIPENLRLLCFHCNQRAWIKIYNRART